MGVCVMLYVHCSVGEAASRSACFEIFGFDILLDRDLKAWLIEVCWACSLPSPRLSLSWCVCMLGEGALVGGCKRLRTWEGGGGWEVAGGVSARSLGFLLDVCLPISFSPPLPPGWA
jgi:hypothetical protein